MDILVEDVKGVICQFLDSVSLAHVGRSDKLFYRLSINETLWERLVDDDYNDVSKYKTCETFREQYVKLRENVKFHLTICCLSNFKDAVMYLLKSDIELLEQDLIFVISMSDVDVYDLPNVKPLIASNYLHLNRHNITITNTAALDWLNVNNMTVDNYTLYITLANRERDAADVVNWYIQHGIQLTEGIAEIAILHNYPNVYRAVSGLGLRGTRESCYFACIRGYIEMLDLLKGQGIMPLNEHVFQTYRDAEPEVRVATLRWLQANGYKATSPLIKRAIKAEDVETLALFVGTYKFTSADLTTAISSDRLQSFMWLHQQGIINNIKVDGHNISYFVLRQILLMGAVNIAEYLVSNNLFTRGDFLAISVTVPQHMKTWLTGTPVTAIPPIIKSKRTRSKANQ